MIPRTVLLAVLALPAARMSWSQGASRTLRRIDVLPNGNVLALDARAKEILCRSVWTGWEGVGGSDGS